MDFRPFGPYFDASENWGDVESVRWFHVHHLWLIRDKLKQNGYNWPMHIHCCFDRTGHSKNSYHGRGLATDFHFGISLSIKLQVQPLITAIKDVGLYYLLGVGVYPFWNSPGFHIDSRGSSIMWYRDENKNYIYGERNVEIFLSTLKV